MHTRQDEFGIAVLDLGSQTFRLAVVSCGMAGHLRVLASETRHVRLSEGLVNTGRITPRAMERGVSALEDFAGIISRLNPRNVQAFGTEVFRKAKNVEEFVNFSFGCGIPVEILAPDEEARLSLLGVSASLPGLQYPFLVLDVGGGSTEIMFVRGADDQCVKSFPFGAVTLAGRYPMGDPPSAFELDSLLEFLDKIFSLEEPFPERPRVLVATGGTATTLAAVAFGLQQYDPRKIRGCILSSTVLDDLWERLSLLPLAGRRSIPGLHPERADIIMSGLGVVRAVLKSTGLSAITVTDGGLLLGLVLHHLRKECCEHAQPSDTAGIYL